MLTNELARAVATTAETVRFYTRKGLISATKNPDNGYKIYDQNALERLQFIMHARRIGFSLKQIDEIIQYSQQGNSPCQKVRKMLSEKIEETKKKIEEYQHHLVLMEETYADWQHEPDMIPNGKAVCGLIESWSENHHALLSKEQSNED